MKSWDVDKDDAEWGGFERTPRQTKFEKFAVEAMEELEANGMADLLLLKNDKLREWWKVHKEEEARKLAARLEKERVARVREEALAKLSTEERKVLGISTGTRRTRNTKSPSEMWQGVMHSDGRLTVVSVDDLEQRWSDYSENEDDELS
jgi:hypothetical protein